MTLATSRKDGRCSARIVLLKEVDEHGFVFYTNYESRKAQELGQNPQAALVFFWAELERQVRVEGQVERVGRQQSEVLFPRTSQGQPSGGMGVPPKRDYSGPPDAGGKASRPRGPLRRN